MSDITTHPAYQQTVKEYQNSVMMLAVQIFNGSNGINTPESAIASAAGFIASVDSVEVPDFVAERATQQAEQSIEWEKEMQEMQEARESQEAEEARNLIHGLDTDVGADIGLAEPEAVEA